MSQLSRILLFGAFTLALPAPVALAQDARPLGDIARDVRARKEAKAKGVSLPAGEAVTADASVPTSLSPERPASQTDPTKLVIPAGTKIRIDTRSQCVAMPVRDDVAVLIPSETKVSLDSSPVYYDPRYSPSATAPQKIVRLTSITIGDKTYDVDSNSVTAPESTQEVTLMLRRPLIIPR